MIRDASIFFPLAIGTGKMETRMELNVAYKFWFLDEGFEL